MRMNTSDRCATSIIDASWLIAHLDDPTVRVVEVDVSRARYDEGHIPGAVLWNAYSDLHHSDYSAIGTREFDVLVSRSGISASPGAMAFSNGMTYTDVAVINVSEGPSPPG